MSAVYVALIVGVVSIITGLISAVVTYRIGKNTADAEVDSITVTTSERVLAMVNGELTKMEARHNLSMESLREHVTRLEREIAVVVADRDHLRDENRTLRHRETQLLAFIDDNGLTPPASP